MKRKMLLIILSSLLVSCGTKESCGSDIQMACDFAFGKSNSDESCTVEETDNGSYVTCSGETVFVSNGTDGEDGEDGSNGVDGEDGADGEDATVTLNPFDIVNIIDPCGDDVSHNDQVIFQLYNGDYVAEVKNGNKKFTTVLEVGTYQTIDKQNCNYEVHSDGSLTW